MEVSSTVLPLTIDEKVEVIKKTKQRGFTAFAEVGKKLIGAGGPKGRMPTSQVIEEMQQCLEAGVFKVVYAHTEIKQLPNESGKFQPLGEIATSVGIEDVMFEVPHGHWHEVAPYAAAHIIQFGSNVNIGDVEPAQAISMESLRCGLGSRTFGKVGPT